MIQGLFERTLNLLARNVVFIDDNPVERASVHEAYPDIRVFGSNPLLWRRILLWSAETQVPFITAESANRTEMVAAQVNRETERRKLTREEFLASLDVSLEMFVVDSREHPEFNRMLELVNKTNQFNSTGRRWAEREIVDMIAEGASIIAFKVRDRFTAYGTVGVVILRANEIVQYVMSCRVLGLDVELGAMATIFEWCDEQGNPIDQAAFVETSLNHLCRDYFLRCGFELTEDNVMRRTGAPPTRPAHIAYRGLEGVAA